MNEIDLDELFDLNPHLDKKEIKNKKIDKPSTKKGSPEGGISSPYADRGAKGRPVDNWGAKSEAGYRPHYRST